MSLNNQIFQQDNLFDRTACRNNSSCWEGTSTKGIVCTAHYRATEAGIRILTKGGNAVDAAVAASLALGVVEPAASGLGGMAMMMLYLADTGKTFMLEGPCRAPVAASPEIFKESRRRTGYTAIAVPTYPAVIDYALRNYGTMKWSAVTESAITLAEEGYLLTPFQRYLLHIYHKSIRRNNAAHWLLNTQGNPPQPGTVMRNPILAQTLKRLAVDGASEFYQGSIGKCILEDMATNGGLISTEDFKTIPWPDEVKPLRGSFRQWDVFTPAPPGGGFAVLEMLNLYEACSNKYSNPDTPEGAALLAAIIQQVRQDRRRFWRNLTKQWALTDPEVLSRSYSRHTANQICSRLSGDGETTHLNVIDQKGNIVALTQSIERSFGAKVATTALGFLYNGFLRTFKVHNQRHPHYMQPGAAARSNASPTILRKSSGRFIAIGSTGSERLASGIFQVLVRLQNQKPFEAVQAPRLHCTPEGEVLCEKDRFDSKIIDYLSKKGFDIVPYPEAWAFSAGGLHLAGLENQSGWGVADPRRDGLAAGPDTIVS